MDLVDLHNLHVIVVAIIEQLSCVFVFRLCINTLGCSSIGYRQTDGMMGNCAVIAPTDAARSPNDIADASNEGWDYINVE